MGYPQDVIGPHLVVRDLVDSKPQRYGLIGFDGAALEVVRSEDVDVDRIAVDELKTVFSSERRALEA